MRNEATYLIVSAQSPASEVLFAAGEVHTRLISSEFYEAHRIPPPENLQLIAGDGHITASVDTYSIGNVVVDYNWHLDRELIATTEDPFYTFTNLENETAYQVQASVTLRTDNLRSDLTPPETATPQAAL